MDSNHKSLQSYLVEVFETWKPEPPEVTQRTKCSVTLDWNPRQFQFIADQLLYRVERNNKMPPWVIVYSGGKTTKLIDYLAPRHPYRFRLRVILKASAVPTLADRARGHYGEEGGVYDHFKEILGPKREHDNNGAGDYVGSIAESAKDSRARQDKADGDNVKGSNTQRVRKTAWLESQWSEETWTSTDTDGTTAACFCMAVRCGYMKQVQGMVEERPALVGIVNSSNGSTPLATAVRKGDLNMVKFLLSAGAEVDQPSSAGQTALQLAVLTRQPLMVELLLERGANFKSRDANGLQVEHYAVDSCDAGVLRLVLARGGDLRARDNNGWTPLFRALCQDASLEMVSELVARGSDTGVKDNAGLPLTSVARILRNRHGRSRDSILRLVDSQYPHEKAFANFTRLAKKLHSVSTILK